MQIKKLSILSSAMLATSIGAASACPTITNDDVNQMILQQADGREQLKVKDWLAEIDWDPDNMGPPRDNDKNVPNNFKPDDIKIDNIVSLQAEPRVDGSKYCDYEIYYGIDTLKKSYIAKLFLGHQ
jgi:hypothetical protein